MFGGDCIIERVYFPKKKLYMVNANIVMRGKTR